MDGAGGSRDERSEARVLATSEEDRDREREREYERERGGDFLLGARFGSLRGIRVGLVPIEATFFAGERLRLAEF